MTYRAQTKKIQILDYPITAAQTDSSGNFLAYATGNDWHQGEAGIGKWSVGLAVHEIVVSDLHYKKGV